MKRRDFLTSSAAATVGLATATLGPKANAAAPGSKALLELRTYHFASAAKQQAFAEFLANAAIPALNRAGVKPVGVWKLLKTDNPRLNLEEDSTDLHVLLPHRDAAEGSRKVDGEQYDVCPSIRAG